MEEILHQLIRILSHYLQGLYIPGGAGFFPSTVSFTRCEISISTCTGFFSPSIVSDVLKVKVLFKQEPTGAVRSSLPKTLFQFFFVFFCVGSFEFQWRKRGAFVDFSHKAMNFWCWVPASSRFPSDFKRFCFLRVLSPNDVLFIYCRWISSYPANIWGLKIVSLNLFK